MAKVKKLVMLIIDWATCKPEPYKGLKGIPRDASTYRGARRNTFYNR